MILAKLKVIKEALIILLRYDLITVAQRDALVTKTKNKYGTQIQAPKDALQNEIDNSADLTPYPANASDNVKAAIDQYNEPVIAKSIMAQLEFDELNRLNIAGDELIEENQE